MIAIIDFKAGNLTSVHLAFNALKVDTCVTSDPQTIASADKIVFPGVGAAKAAMSSLSKLHLLDVLREQVSRGTPFLGICIGMQLLFQSSEEDGGTDCLGALEGRVRRFAPKEASVKIPHMGWNTVSQQQTHPLFSGIEDNSEFYFVHSFYCDPEDGELVVATTDYAGVSFCSAVARNNLIATQFHPERSGRMGLALLKNFCAWEGVC